MAQKSQPGTKKERFLEILGRGYSVTRAAYEVGVARRTAYHWRADPDFLALWNDALEDGTDLLEDEARRRAIDSSDSLLKFLLTARRPAIYRERASFDIKTTAPPPPEPAVGKFAHLSDEELSAKYFQEFGVKPGFAGK
jgi:hypothetical protein